MVTLLYHAKAVGPICRKIAAASNGAIRAVNDKEIPHGKCAGTVIRWDSRREWSADKTINSAAAVVRSRNKVESRRLLEGLCPTTWFREEDLRYPCIIRPARHHAALHFYVCQDKRQARRAIARCPRDWYASPIINKQFEYRVIVFEGKCVKVVRRSHPDPEIIAWNIANGGRNTRLKKSSWPMDVVGLAIKSADVLRLGWCAVDAIVDHDGNPYVLELNTAPGILRGETQTKLAEVFTEGQ